MARIDKYMQLMKNVVQKEKFQYVAVIFVLTRVGDWLL